MFHLKVKIMKKRKYRWFIFADETETWETGDWHNVFRNFTKSVSATVYGLPNQDGANYEIIMSK
jgi:hypothetical protein